MKEVTVHDKRFVALYPPGEIGNRIAEMGLEISRDLKAADPIVVGVLNGAFLFYADLIRALSFDPEVSFVRLASYHGGMSSSGVMDTRLWLPEPPEGREVLVVEDIVDTGGTVQYLRKRLLEEGAKKVHVATLLFKPHQFKGDPDPEYVGFSIENKFVIGYGLDYRERGRNLDGIYVLKD